MPLARISLTLTHHFFLSFIASGRSSGLHTVSSHSCCMYVRAGRPAFAREYVGVHKSTSLMSSSLLLQQCPACLVRPTWIVLVMGGRWPYSWCLVGCCRQDLFNIARNILFLIERYTIKTAVVRYHLLNSATFKICIIIIIIIIIKSYYKLRFLWISPSIRPYHPSLLAGFLKCIMCPHRAVVDSFLVGWQTLVRPCVGVHRRTSHV